MVTLIKSSLSLWTRKTTLCGISEYMLKASLANIWFSGIFTSRNNDLVDLSGRNMSYISSYKSEWVLDILRLNIYEDRRNYKTRTQRTTTTPHTNRSGTRNKPERCDHRG